MHLVKFKFNNSKYQLKSKNLEKGVAFIVSWNAFLWF